MRPSPPWGVGGRVPSCHLTASARCICACCTRSGTQSLCCHMWGTSSRLQRRRPDLPRQRHISATSAPQEAMWTTFFLSGSQGGNNDTRESSLYFPLPPFHGQKLRYSWQLRSPNASIASILTPGSQGVTSPIPSLTSSTLARLLFWSWVRRRVRRHSLLPTPRPGKPSVPTLPARPEFL